MSSTYRVFTTEEHLVQYLTKHPQGRSLVRETVLLEDWAIQDVLDSHKASYVLVKAFRDGLVEVYCKRHVRPRIAFLGRSVTFPEHELLAERELDRSLPEPYRLIHLPGYMRAAALRGHDG